METALEIKREMRIIEAKNILSKIKEYKSLTKSKKYDGVYKVIRGFITK